jgi:folate-dependent phosphoribosylglycinamide formyltransferase PurN
MSQKLKIGLLLDSLKVPRWVYDLILQLQSDDSYELNLILINKGPKMASRSSFIYRVLRKIDERLFAFGASPFSRKSINVGNAKIVEVNPIRKKFSDYFPDEVIHQIEADKPDLFLRFGFRILRGKILSASQYGILSLHHGDTASYRGGPPAFWEVIENSKTTGVTLQILTEALDSGIILSKTILRTDTNSFYRNQQKIYWAGSKLFIEQLNEMAKIGVDNYLASKQSVYANEPKGKLYRNPDHSTSLIILVQFVLRTIIRQLISFSQPINGLF